MPLLCPLTLNLFSFLKIFHNISTYEESDCLAEYLLIGICPIISSWNNSFICIPIRYVIIFVKNPDSWLYTTKLYFLHLYFYVFPARKWALYRAGSCLVHLGDLRTQQCLACAGTHSLSFSACSSFSFICCITIHLTTHSSQLAMLTPHFPLLFLPPLNNHSLTCYTRWLFLQTSLHFHPHLRPSASSPELFKQPSKCPPYCRSPPHQI